MRRNWTKQLVREDGGIALEAALVMPFFLAFVLALAVLLKLGMADLALQRALSETVKPIAAYAYPVELAALEVKQAYDRSEVGSEVNEVIARTKAAREMLVRGEQWTDRFEAFIPDFMLDWIEWERQKRVWLETESTERVKELQASVLQPIVREAFKKLVLQAADSTVIAGARLRVVDVELPKLADREHAFIGLAAEYDVRLPIPFFQRTVTLRKQAYERLWVGA
ncbi:hypothetical protein [Paenibacillus koleovorans]|uniref:hypothetical protein n=1 Tax=Paenibacillus koleovorans TaxID=121608 RepID=UPI000FD8BD6C|nr:hypothetical protein [Paenibacillus koleovorans]